MRREGGLATNRFAMHALLERTGVAQLPLQSEAAAPRARGNTAIRNIESRKAKQVMKCGRLKDDYTGPSLLFAHPREDDLGGPMQLGCR